MSDLIERLRQASLHEDSIEEEAIAEIERLEARCLKLYKANEKQYESIAKLQAVLVELRDEIIPHWSKREAISAINEALEDKQDD